jgi:hypothetical protein
MMKRWNGTPTVEQQPDRLKGGRTGEALVAAMQASPFREIDIEPGAGARPCATSICDRPDTNILSAAIRPRLEPEAAAFVAIHPLAAAGRPGHGGVPGRVPVFDPWTAGWRLARWQGHPRRRNPHGAGKIPGITGAKPPPKPDFPALRGLT